MNLACKLEAMVVAKNSKKSQDGKTTYYSIAVVSNGEAGSINCVEEVYLMAQEFKMYNMVANFNDTYKSLKVTIIAPTVENSNPVAATQAATGTQATQQTAKK